MKQKFFILAGHKEPWCNGIDTDSCFGEMHSQPLGKVADGCFCPAVSRDLGQWSKGIHGRNIQNAASFSVHHIFCKNLGWKQCSNEVQVKYKLYTALIQIKERNSISLNVTWFKVFFCRSCSWIVAACSIDQDVAS